MRIPTFHLVLTMVVGGVVLAGCGNVRPEKTQRTTREAKTGKTDAGTDKTDDQAEGSKTADPTTAKAAKTAAGNGTDKASGKEPVPVAQAAKNEKSAEKSDGESLEPSRSALILPTGDKSNSLLAIETISPKRHQVNRDYKYEIRVTNVSDRSNANVSLSDVRVTQHIRGKMTLSDAKVTIKGKDGNEVKGRGSKAKLPAEKDPSAVWTFDLLEPGDQAVITVTAKGSESGKLLSDLSVHYEPLLRLETEIAEPAVQLTKAGPKDPVDNSRKIQYTYVLKNKGKETVQDLTVEDKLAAGLKTAGGDAEAGKDVVKLQCDRLDGGAEKKWTVTVEAPKTGTYTSRAAVTWPGVKGSAPSTAKLSEWQTESAAVTTQVRLGKLKVAVQPDPATQYAGQKVTYSVTITNEGHAKVDRPQLVATLDKAARRAGSEPAAEGNTWTLPALDPGKTSSPIKITVTSDAAGKLESKFEASFDCDGQKMADAASVTAEIKPLGVKAEPIPSQAQLEQGDLFICLLQLSNEGKSRDTGLKLSLQLPEIVSYEGMEGGSEATFDDKTRTVTLAAIKQIEPREKPRPLRVRVKAQKAGKGLFTVALTSDALGDARLSFESEPVTIAAKKPAAKAPIDAPEARPTKTEKAKDQEKPAAEKAEPAPSKKDESQPKETGGSKDKPAEKD